MMFTFWIPGFPCFPVSGRSFQLRTSGVGHPHGQTLRGQGCFESSMFKKKIASLELPITYGEWRERAIWSYGYSYSHIFPIQWGAVWSYQEFPKHILVTHCLFHIYFISVKFVGYNTIQSWLHQSYCHSWCHGCIMLPSLIGSLKRLPIPTSNQPSLATTGNQASNMRFHQHVLWSLSGMTLIYHR